MTGPPWLDNNIQRARQYIPWSHWHMNSALFVIYPNTCPYHSWPRSGIQLPQVLVSWEPWLGKNFWNVKPVHLMTLLALNRLYCLYYAPSLVQADISIRSKEYKMICLIVRVQGFIFLRVSFIWLRFVFHLDLTFKSFPWPFGTEPIGSHYDVSLKWIEI